MGCKHLAEAIMIPLDRITWCRQPLLCMQMNIASIAGIGVVNRQVQCAPGPEPVL